MIGNIINGFIANNEQLESSNSFSADVIYCLEATHKTVEIGKDLLNDLEVIHPYDHESYESTLVNIFHSNTKTLGGKKILEDILTTPQYDINLLENRKDCISKLNRIDDDISFKKLEQDLLWIFTEKEDTINELLNSIYFSSIFLKKLNHYETFTTPYNFYKMCISPTLGILSPLLYVIMPFIVLKYKFGNQINISFNTYIKVIWRSVITSQNLFSMVGAGGNTFNRIKIITYVLTLCFYFQGIVNSVQIAFTTNKVIAYICDKINNAFKFMKYALKCVNDNKDIINKCKMSFIQNSLEDIDEKLIHTLDSYSPYDGDFSIFSNFGKQLRLFKEMDKSILAPLVNVFYLLDALSSVKSVKVSLDLCTPTFIEYNTIPIFNTKNSWNIHLDPLKSIRNDCDVKNTIITGPNAGGKSTFIKMICTNILLSQTVCICAASSLELTPFYLVSSQINIPDCKGQESLFEAEMNRCLFNLNNIEKLREYPCFLVMDEIFNSTNVIEAISGAYAILEQISQHSNTICVITTHLNYLTNLKKTSNFECKCMSVNINENGIEYPYKLKNGISKQYIALELLKENGFDTSIIKKALEIKNKFTK